MIAIALKIAITVALENWQDLLDVFAKDFGGFEKIIARRKI
jgi:hypothetical protein